MPIWIAVILVLFSILSVCRIRDEKRKHDNCIANWKKSFGDPDFVRSYSEQEYDQLTHFFRMKNYDNSVDDRTFEDLNLKEVFSRVDRCQSFYGAEQLYTILRTPLYDLKELEKRENLIHFMEKEESVRVLFQECFSHIGRGQVFPLCDCMAQLNEIKRRSVLPDYLFLGLTIVSTVLLFTWNVVGVLVFCLSVFFSVIFYYREKHEVESYLNAFRQILKTIHAGKDLLKKRSVILADFMHNAGTDELLKDWFDRIEKSTDDLEGFQRFSFLIVGGRSMTGSLLDVILDYFRMLWHFDIIRFYKMIKIAQSKSEEILNLSVTIGKMDAMIGIASYRNSLPKVCVPSISIGERSFEARGLYHPLKANAVPSDVCTERSILITGSNASGKSTFLRSCGIAAIFAQTIHAVPADSYRAGMYNVISSMALTDDLMNGESYYIAEIKSIKRILEASGKKETVLCVMDEVLRGTNTAERIAAATEILRSLSKSNALCFAATHDLELTYLLEEDYDNYHFSGYVDGEKMVFPYILIKGRAEDRNAISLLRLMGYDSSIIERAEMSCKNYLESGTWEV